MYEIIGNDAFNYFFSIFMTMSIPIALSLAMISFVRD